MRIFVKRSYFSQVLEKTSLINSSWREKIEKVNSQKLSNLELIEDSVPRRLLVLNNERISPVQVKQVLDSFGKVLYASYNSLGYMDVIYKQFDDAQKALKEISIVNPKLAAEPFFNSEFKMNKSPLKEQRVLKISNLPLDYSFKDILQKIPKMFPIARPTIVNRDGNSIGYVTVKHSSVVQDLIADLSNRNWNGSQISVSVATDSPKNCIRVSNWGSAVNLHKFKQFLSKNGLFYTSHMINTDPLIENGRVVYFEFLTEQEAKAAFLLLDKRDFSEYTLKVNYFTNPFE